MYGSIIEAVNYTPWAILPEKLAEIRRFLALKASGQEVDPETIKALAAGRRSMDVGRVGKVAILPVQGVLSQRVSLLGESSGGVSAERIGATLDELFSDRNTKAVVMAYDSPGGSVFGIQELGAKIRGHVEAGRKIVALADSLAASAAYWLASQASEVWVTPGGQVGSIGVITAHVDQSKLDEAMGLKTTYIASSRYKAELQPEQPLSEEARVSLQEKVDTYHSAFVAAVAQGRGVTARKVEDTFGQGRIVLAREAKDRGMVDRIGTLDQLLKHLGAYEGAGPRAEAAEEQDRVRLRLAALRHQAAAAE